MVSSWRPEVTLCCFLLCLFRPLLQNKPHEIWTNRWRRSVTCSGCEDARFPGTDNGWICQLMVLLTVAPWCGGSSRTERWRSLTERANSSSIGQDQQPIKMQKRCSVSPLSDGAMFRSARPWGWKEEAFWNCVRQEIYLLSIRAAQQEERPSTLPLISYWWRSLNYWCLSCLFDFVQLMTSGSWWILTMLDKSEFDIYRGTVSSDALIITAGTWRQWQRNMPSDRSIYFIFSFHSEYFHLIYCHLWRDWKSELRGISKQTLQTELVHQWFCLLRCHFCC